MLGENNHAILVTEDFIYSTFDRGSNNLRIIFPKSEVTYNLKTLESQIVKIQ